jgi:hypothetical protein
LDGEGIDLAGSISPIKKNMPINNMELMQEKERERDRIDVAISLSSINKIE